MKDIYLSTPKPGADRIYEKYIGVDVGTKPSQSHAFVTDAEGKVYDLGVVTNVVIRSAYSFRKLRTTMRGTVQAVARYAGAWERLLIRHTPKSKPWKRPRSQSRRERLRRLELLQRWHNKGIVGKTGQLIVDEF